MSFDMDLRRDAASAFGSASFVEGAVLPYEGRSRMRAPDGLPAAVWRAEQDGWLSPNNPILVRGLTKILPLAWRGDPTNGYGTAVEPEEITAFASEIQAAGMYWAGNWRILDLTEQRSDSIGSYIDALRAAGATRVDCWTYSQTTGLALVWAGVEEEGTMSLALHVVPVSWVSEPRVLKGVRGIDVRWSWAEVITLHEARQVGDQEGQAMDITELMHFVHAEQLDAPVLYGAGRLHDDAVVLERQGAAWNVYLVDERTSMIRSTRRTFDSEGDAIEHVLLKLRQVKKARHAMGARVRRAAEHDAV